MDINLTTNIGQQIIEIANAVAKQFGVAIDWSRENIMPVLKDLSSKLVSYEVVTSYVFIALFAFIILALVAIMIVIVRSYHCDPDVVWPCAIVFGLLIVIFIAALVSQVFDIVECKVFPEKYIFEYAQTLLKQ